MSQLECTIKNVLWTGYNEAGISGYGVISSEIPDDIRNEKYPQSAVLKIAKKLTEGQKFICEGEWEKTTKGWNFFAKDVVEQQETDLDMIIDHISRSPLYKGISHKLAKDIVAKFGENAMDVMSSEPEKLLGIPGIRRDTIKSLIESAESRKEVEELIKNFSSYLPLSKIYKIHQRYGSESFQTIIQNPYRLYLDFADISFQISDKIAYSCNIPHADIRRIEAGVIMCLKRMDSSGHLFCPLGELVDLATAELGSGQITGEIHKNEIYRVCLELKEEEEIIFDQNDVYLPWNYKCELYAAFKLRNLRDRERFLNLNMEDSINEMQEEYGIKYAQKQLESFYKLASSNLMIITGGPGTGKTTIIKGIIGLLKKDNPAIKIALCAPTGRAAKRMSEATQIKSKTIHRLLEYKPFDEDDAVYVRNETNPLDADVVIVDEASMLDQQLIGHFLRAIDENNTSLIIVGDIDQLPSVGAGAVLKEMINCDKLPVVQLNEIFRQADTSKIIINAQKVNDGDKDFEYSEDEFVFIEAEDEDIPKKIQELFLKELQRVKDINEIQVLTPYRVSTEVGSVSLNDTLQAILNPAKPDVPQLEYGTKQKKAFRVNDKCMQHKNNYDKDVFNGDVSTVVSVNPERMSLVLNVDGEEHEFFKDELDQISLAYACTVHKSQGAEYDTIIMPLSMMNKRLLARNILYTAVTRAKKKVILVGSPVALNYCVNNNVIAYRNSKLGQRI